MKSRWEWVRCETLILEPFLFDYLPQVSSLPYYGGDPLRVRSIVNIEMIV